MARWTEKAAARQTSRLSKATKDAIERMEKTNPRPIRYNRKSGWVYYYKKP
jgi:hypothetical protein